MLLLLGESGFVMIRSDLGGHLRGHANRPVVLQHGTEKFVAADGWQERPYSTHDFTNFGWWNFGRSYAGQASAQRLGLSQSPNLNRISCFTPSSIAL